MTVSTSPSPRWVVSSVSGPEAPERIVLRAIRPRSVVIVDHRGAGVVDAEVDRRIARADVLGGGWEHTGFNGRRLPMAKGPYRVLGQHGGGVGADAGTRPGPSRIADHRCGGLSRFACFVPKRRARSEDQAFGTRSAHRRRRLKLRLHAETPEPVVRRRSIDGAR